MRLSESAYLVYIALFSNSGNPAKVAATALTTKESGQTDGL